MTLTLRLAFGRINIHACMAQISRRVFHQVRAVIEESHPCVVSSAKQPANNSGMMIMVNNQPAVIRQLLTDSTNSALSRENFDILLNADTVLRIQIRSPIAIFRSRCSLVFFSPFSSFGLKLWQYLNLSPVIRKTCFTLSAMTIGICLITVKIRQLFKRRAIATFLHSWISCGKPLLLLNVPTKRSGVVNTYSTTIFAAMLIVAISMKSDQWLYFITANTASLVYTIKSHDLNLPERLGLWSGLVCWEHNLRASLF